MRCILWIIVGLAAVSAWVRGDEPASAPKGAPPRYGIASLARDGQIQVCDFRSIPRTETRTRVVERDGGPKRMETYSTVYENVPTVSLYDSKSVQVFDHKSRPVKQESLAALLRGETHILLSADGKEVDPYYLQHFKEGTLVFVIDPFEKFKNLKPAPMPAPAPAAPQKPRPAPRTTG